MKKMVRWLAPLAAVLWAVPVMAQGIYGTGNAAFVPKTDAGSITFDGVMSPDEPWSKGLYLNGTAGWSGGWNEGMAPTPDIIEDSWVLYSEDTLYVFVSFEDYELYYNEDMFGSDVIYIGVDPQHVAGDTLSDDNWSGWPWHDADSIRAFQAWSPGFTLGGDSLITNPPVPWLNGVMTYDETNATMTVEAAIYVPGLQEGSAIGFNIGGASAVSALAGSDNGPAYAFFSWQNDGNPGGDVLHSNASYGSLLMLGEGATAYGTGEAAYMPKAAAGSITVDGMMGDGEPWSQGLYINGTAGWSGGWNEGMAPTPDIIEDSWVLYGDDTLYVFVSFEDYELYYNEDMFGSDVIYVGVDPQHVAGDTLSDDNWSGWPWHDADSIRAFQAWSPGFTIGGDSSLTDPQVSWLNGVMNYDETNATITVEAAIYVPGLRTGSAIGFNIGGASAVSALAGSDNGPAYAFFSWQNDGNPGGDVLHSNASYGTLFAADVTVGTGVEEDYSSEIPDRFALRQNYPNPFNPATTIEYELTRSGRVTLDVYDVVGHRVATLINDERPAGTYTLRWDASGLSSGTYLYQLRINGDVIGSRLMTLIK